jgi:hypothetical protein
MKKILVLFILTTVVWAIYEYSKVRPRNVGEAVELAHRITGLVRWKGGGPADAPPQQTHFEADHLHDGGSCSGILTVGTTEVAYKTDHSLHSRIWSLGDVQRLLPIGPAIVHIATNSETLHFNLKRPLGEGEYEHLWKR